MKQYHVYELFDQDGKIVYVGISKIPEVRFKKHTRTKPSPGNGYFYGRTDLKLRIHSSHYIRQEAYKAEGYRKLELNMPWTERKWIGTNQGKGGKIVVKRLHICPHCNKEGKGPIMQRWHGSNCKSIKALNQKAIQNH